MWGLKQTLDDGQILSFLCESLMRFLNFMVIKTMRDRNFTKKDAEMFNRKCAGMREKGGCIHQKIWGVKAKMELC